MSDLVQGNKVDSSSYMQLVQAMKRNFARDNHVAEVVQVQSIDSNLYNCSLINQPQLVITCRVLDGVTIAVGDLALVVFTDTDFRDNVIRAQQSQPVQPKQFQQFHQLFNGIIIGKFA